MATVKTALSLPEPLLADAAKLAQELGTSRSQVFVIALEDFLRRRRNRQILARLDEVYSDPPDPAEKAVIRRWGNRHAELVRSER